MTTIASSILIGIFGLKLFRKIVLKGLEIIRLTVGLWIRKIKG